MNSRKKMINELRFQLNSKEVKDQHYPVQLSVSDANTILTLLKEQETEWEHLWDAPDGTFKGRCKKCGFVHFFIEGHNAQYKFCPECGKVVRWNE